MSGNPAWGQIKLLGGRHGIIDENVVDSALHKPQHLDAYEPDSDIAALAAAYLSGFAQKQEFADGNTPTALAVTLTFLRLNRHELNVAKAELLEFGSSAEPALPRERFAIAKSIIESVRTESEASARIWG